MHISDPQLGCSSATGSTAGGATWNVRTWETPVPCVERLSFVVVDQSLLFVYQTLRWSRCLVRDGGRPGLFG